MSQYGSSGNPTGNPIGGGAGYSDIKTGGNKYVKTAAEAKAALATAKSGDVIFVGEPALTLHIRVKMAQALKWGVNLSGLEFGAVHGVYGTDYISPTYDEVAYYQSKGMGNFRLPFLWERVQHTLGGTLDSADLGILDAIINQQTILDLHNYARYKGSVVTPSQLADVWSRLASYFKGRVYAYGLMNEPHDISSWFYMAQAAINAIRAVDSQTPIIVSGNDWSHSHTWPQVNDDLQNLTGGNLIYEAHCYFDSDFSGQYKDNVKPADPVALLSPFVDWLTENGKKGIIGETGVPADWLDVWKIALDYLSAKNISIYAWAGGPWWGDYPLSLDPVDGVDRPQITMMEAYL